METSIVQLMKINLKGNWWYNEIVICEWCPTSFFILINLSWSESWSFFIRHRFCNQLIFKFYLYFAFPWVTDALASFIRDVNAFLGRPNPIAVISATTCFTMLCSLNIAFLNVLCQKFLLLELIHPQMPWSRA